MPQLEGKVAFITGAGAGIGRASALLFAQEGAHVIIAERDVQAGEDTAAWINASVGNRAQFFQTDVTKAESLATAVQQTVAQYGRFDVLYNNAGGSTLQDGRVTDAPVQAFWDKMTLDVFGAWLGCRYGIQAMLDAGHGGSVINAASIFGLIGIHGKDAYTAAKGAIIALTRSMAVEYAPYRIRVNAVAPGATATARILKRLQEGAGSPKLREGQLLGLIQPEDVAQAALWLASEASKATTGHILTVDGGLTMS